MPLDFDESYKRYKEAVLDHGPLGTHDSGVHVLAAGGDSRPPISKLLPT